MNIDMSRFKVVYDNKVLNAVALGDMQFKTIREGEEPPSSIYKPEMIEIIALNEDGNIIIICDEAWRFQFLPIVGSN